MTRLEPRSRLCFSATSAIALIGVVVLTANALAVVVFSVSGAMCIIGIILINRLSVVHRASLRSSPLPFSAASAQFHEVFASRTP
eukprot:3759178-Pleurochrysis_carterae.AAC.1